MSNLTHKPDVDDYSGALTVEKIQQECYVFIFIGDRLSKTRIVNLPSLNAIANDHVKELKANMRIFIRDIFHFMKEEDVGQHAEVWYRKQRYYSPCKVNGEDCYLACVRPT